MANEKIMNTRIQLKYDSLTAWQASAFNNNTGDKTKYLKAGEVAIVVLANSEWKGDAIEKANHPLLFKVGTGEHRFDDLPFASALAADVYAWAKKPEAEFIEWVNEQIEHPVLSVKDEETGKFVTGVEVNDHEITIHRANVVVADIADLVDNDTVTVVDQGTGIKVEESVEANVHTYIVSHQEKPTQGTAETATAGSGRTYVTEVLVDELGHIAGVKTATETVVDTDTNTAHSHKNGAGIALNE